MLDKNELRELEIKTEPILRAAGKTILDSWHQIHSTKLKDKRDLVTNVDIEVEEKIRTALTRLLPEAGFIVEEGKTEFKKEYNWVIDPIDGTKNYVNFLPIFVTQIALHRNGVPVLGQIYNPVSNQFFSASLENGTYFNNNLVKHLPQREAEEAIIDLDFGGIDEIIDWKTKVFSTLAKNFFRVRVFGGVVTCYMVTGAIDGYISIDRKVKIVDIAPNLIILSEAGIATEELNLYNKKIIICAHKKLLSLLKEKVCEVC